MMFGALGLCGGVLVNVGMALQVIKILRTKSAWDLSLTSYSLALAGMVLITVYGLHLGDTVVNILNFIGLLLVFFMVAVIWRYGTRATGRLGSFQDKSRKI